MRVWLRDAVTVPLSVREMVTVAVTEGVKEREGELLGVTVLDAETVGVTVLLPVLEGD